MRTLFIFRRDCLFCLFYSFILSLACCFFSIFFCVQLAIVLYNGDKRNYFTCFLCSIWICLHFLNKLNRFLNAQIIKAVDWSYKKKRGTFSPINLSIYMIGKVHWLYNDNWTFPSFFFSLVIAAHIGRWLLQLFLFCSHNTLKKIKYLMPR